MGLMSGIYANGGPGSTLPPYAPGRPNPPVTTGMDSILGRASDLQFNDLKMEMWKGGKADADMSASMLPMTGNPRRRMKKIEEAVLGKEI